MKKILILTLSISFAVLKSTGRPVNAYSVPSTNGWTEYGGASFIVGYDFTPAVAINVTSLGILDWYGDGLINPSSVGIWDVSGTLLASTTLPAGKLNAEPAGAANLEFYYQAIAPLALTAGITYRIGNQMTGGATEVVGFDGSFTGAPEILFGPGWGNNGITFARPVEFASATPFMGSAFKYQVIVQAVPEPAGLVVWVGSLSVWVWRKRKQ